MNEAQQIKLKALREKYVDGDSRMVISDIEKKLTALIEEKNFVSHPVFQAIVKDAQKKIEEINIILQTDRKLTDIQRESLFIQKEVWTFSLHRFGLKDVDAAIKYLEQDIDYKLNQ